MEVGSKLLTLKSAINYSSLASKLIDHFQSNKLVLSKTISSFEWNQSNFLHTDFEVSWTYDVQWTHARIRIIYL